MYMRVRVFIQGDKNQDDVPHALQYALVTGTLRTRATASPALRNESTSSVVPTRKVKTVQA